MHATAQHKCTTRAKLTSQSDMDLPLAFCSALLLAVMLPLSANASSKLYVVYMGEKHHDDPSVVTASHHDILNSLLGSKDEAMKSIVYSYKHGFSGFAAMLTESQAEILAGLPEVISVKPNINDRLHTTQSWDFLGLNYYQPPSSQEYGLLQKANYGADIIVGVIDSGVWPESRSFDDTGYGPVPARWKGICQVGVEFNATSCNRKIIGARWYSEGFEADTLKGEYMSARDRNGHGTHVASTAVGGQVWNASYNGLGAGVARGGAPRARLAIYKACWGGGVCSRAAIIAAIDDAIHDGVDVLSLSVGGPGSEYIETLHVVQRGIPVVFAGMNDGPVPQTVQNTVPWVITVAASTIDRSFPTAITLGNNETLVGQSLDSTDSSDFQELAWISDMSVPSNLTGKTVLYYVPGSKILLFTLPRLTLGQVVNITKTAGAKGLIFAQHTDNNLVPWMDSTGLPCVLVDFEIARRIAFYYENTGDTTPVVKVSPPVSVVGDGVPSPRIAAFSSRGPSATFPAILKPDIAAPGANILAAMGNSYKFYSGTSMACPHVSAVVALLKSVHPNWSPAMIKSAIVTTASMTDHFGAPIESEGVPRKLGDPFDYGGGHINPDRAADPGLVYDIDAREYMQFSNCTAKLFDDCGTYKGQLYQLNLPSIALPDLKDSITVRRTITNVGPTEATYRAVVEAPTGVAVCVEPPVIKFTKGSSKSSTFTVTFKANRRVQGGYTFGSLTWLDDRTHSARIPIAVRTVINDIVPVADAS